MPPSAVREGELLDLLPVGRVRGLLPSDVNLHPPVDLPPLRRIVRCFRARGAVTVGGDLRGEDALVDQVTAHGVGAALRQMYVGLLCADAVGVAFDVVLLVLIV